MLPSSSVHSSARARAIPVGFTILLVALLAAGPVSVVNGQEAPPPHPIGELVESCRDRFALPGVSVSLFSNDRILTTFFKGVRDVEGKAPLQPTDMFHLASCGKALTATLAAIAVERGALSWDTTVGESLELPEESPCREVTLRQLLTHHAGVATLTDDETELFKRAVTEAPKDPVAARAHLARLVLAEAPLAKPGVAAHYSNAGYAIAGAMLERACGVAFEKMLVDEVFEPLGLRHAIVGWPATKERPEQPRGHRVVDGKRVPDELSFADEVAALVPAGGCSMAIEDLAEFARAHLRALAGDEAIISAKSATTLHTPASDGMHAMGWMIRDLHGEKVHYHDGGTGHFSVAMMLLPSQQLGVVVATNVGGGQGAGGEGCQSLCMGVLQLAVRQKRKDSAGRR